MNGDRAIDGFDDWNVLTAALDDHVQIVWPRHAPGTSEWIDDLPMQDGELAFGFIEWERANLAVIAIPRSYLRQVCASAARHGLALVEGVPVVVKNGQVTLFLTGYQDLLRGLDGHGIPYKMLPLQARPVYTLEQKSGTADLQSRAVGIIVNATFSSTGCAGIPNQMV